ncbi:MAG TPA: serine/threonine-protein kinase [Blastocatellia bacterium]|nr:serine/threonine-protein kinase [Blastocatellia bacterium]
MSRAALINSSVGDYRLVDYIGAGGMGEVYRAVHSKIGRVVAVKVLTQSVPSPSFITRFHNEARIQASLHHHNIATLYDFLEFNGQPCIVMEYVDGETLTERISRFGSLPVEEALYIFQTVAEAIHYIHGQGVLHRDIKSNNIKISSTGEVKLLDFGIAKSGDTPSMTRTGDVIGTLEYLSPEQVKAGNADARSDIWALGTLLYEMMTGNLPFKSPNIGDLCDKICKAQFASVSSLNPSVPHEVEAIILRCLKKKPADRYQTAADVLQDTKRIASKVPAPRLKGTNVTSLVAGAKKNSWKLTALAAAVVVLIVGIYFLLPSSDNSSGRSSDSGNIKTQTKAPDKQTANQISKSAPGLERYRIATMDGTAVVELTGRNGKQVGQTPFEFDAPIGERFDMVLKREGFKELRDNFTVTVNKREFNYTLTKQ